MKIVLFLTFLISNIFGFNIDIHRSTIANAQTAFLEFKKEKNIRYTKVMVGKRSFIIQNHPSDNKKMFALLPMSYYEKPITKKIKIFYTKNGVKKTKFIFLKIEDGAYEKEEIQVAKEKVNPTKKKVKKRIAKEYKEAMSIYNTYTRVSHITSRFIAPLTSKITSDFGKARIYNGTLSGYHSGTDYRAKIGTPIQSSNDGVVVLAKDRFYSGGTVIIDHGYGIYSCYFHLSAYKVKYGQKVKKADIIGLSGDSGRVTGPHLHFSFRVSGVQVDPLHLMKLLNKKILTR